MITNQITTANTFSDWVGSTQAIITYLNNTETLPNDAIEIATTANNTANYANSQVDLAFINSQEAYDAANDSLIITGFAYDTANTANTTALYAYDQANTGTSIANFANDVAIFANTRINTIYNGSEILVPTGSTAQRPVTPSTGMFRYNTDTNQFEGYATAWMPVGGVPVGAVIPFIGGYFTNGSNAGYTNVLGNTVTNVNSLLNSTGWYVCNGATINLANSPIFNGSNRYLPNITDSRFIMGSASSGTIGGSNSTVHTHSLNNHTHGMGHNHPMPHTHDVAAHSHAMNHLHLIGGHAHLIPAHSHLNNFTSQLTILGTEHLAAHQHFTGFQHNSSDNLAAGSGHKTVNAVAQGYANKSTGLNYGHSHHVYGATAAQEQFNTHNSADFWSSGIKDSNTGGDISTTGNASPSTGQPLTNTSTSDSSISITAQSSGDTGSKTIENRPTFISCIYIMRVF
jgi:hypothetical protein